MRLVALSLALCAAAGLASAITIDIDYRYDSSNFFGAGNPQGAAAGLQAQAALEVAASFFSNILNDTFLAITVPSPYHSSVSNGVVSWRWEQRFKNPSSGIDTQIVNPSVPANQFIVYAGARSLPGISAGIGEVGGYSWGSEVTGTNSFTPSDIGTINQTSANFENAVERRGEPSGFARWGGAIAFDTDTTTRWHFNHGTPPSGNVTDFFSVAIHELAHALGFGSQSFSGTSDWSTLVSGSFFTGTNARAQNGGNPVPLHPLDLAHWATGTSSVVYGSTTPQEAAMDPDLQNGSRKRFTALDAAAMKDIGWEVIPLAVPLLYGDYNNNGVVDAADYVVWRKRLNQSVTIPNDSTPGMVSTADYTIWRSNFGKALLGGSGATLAVVPEPAGILLALVGGITICAARRKRRR